MGSPQDEFMSAATYSSKQEQQSIFAAKVQADAFLRSQQYQQVKALYLVDLEALTEE